MSNTKSKKTKSKTGLARCMELASDRKGLIFYLLSFLLWQRLLRLSRT